MRVFFRYFLLLASFSSFAQQTPYQPFEVDSAASPNGGIASLNTFIQANLRKPIAAQAEGIGGRIIVSAVVEPDGSTSNAKLVSRLRPDCDREALRVFNLFKAWKPAQKDGKAVRQQITTSVVFKANPLFLYRDGAQVSYFDAEQRNLTDSNAAVRYKQVNPLDSNGFANGDIVLYKLKGSTWKEDYRAPLVREENHKNGLSDQSTVAVGYQPTDKLWEGKVLLFSQSGTLISQLDYKKGIPTRAGTMYHPNGAVAQITEKTEYGFACTSWYPSGQVKQAWSNIPSQAEGITQTDLVITYWDDKGRQLVKDGNGYAVYQEEVPSRSDSLQRTTLTEQGLYENNYRQGIWTGRYADGSYGFEEEYKKGILLQGKAWVKGGDTLQYTEISKQPEFEGGMIALSQFLSNNLNYPLNLQQAGTKGRVFVSFVVCTDGTLCDYDIAKGVHPELNKEALRVVKKMSGHWKPGSFRGQNVRVHYNLPISFRVH